MRYLCQENVGVRDDEVAIREELALGRSSGRKGDFPSMNTSPTASDTTTNIISQVSLPENCDWCEKMIGVPERGGYP
jgi:hypothetical protein